DERKDPITAARAAAKVREPLVFLIAGEGPLRPTLARFAEQHREVRLLGHRSDVDRLLAAADVFVLSSWREGFSYALLEAMSAGVVPVVSDAPGNPEAVGEAGVVFRRGDEQE